MPRDSSDFLRVLFDEHEHTCFGDDAKGWRVEPVTETHGQFFCINPLDGSVDRCPTKEWHSPDRPRRDDGNVVSFRNFLIEFDRPELGGPKDQLEYVRARGVPFSTAVWSGGKSVHFIISLQESLTREEYALKARRIIEYMGSDKSCKNPSRFSRLPGVMRDNGQLQALLWCGERLSMERFREWMETIPRLVAKPPRRNVILHAGEKRQPPYYVVEFLEDGILCGGSRTTTLFACAAALAECGYSIDETRERLKPRTDTLYNPGEYPVDKVESTIRDAFRRVFGGDVE